MDMDTGMGMGMGTVICTLLFRFEQHPKHLSQNKHVERHKKKESDTDIGTYTYM